MDLLGSILNSMEKPPTVSDKQRNLIKKQKEEFMKKQKEEKEKLKQFREKAEQKINEFLQNESLQKKKFEPMDLVYRSIIHDVAEVAGIPAFSIGEEGVDRHVMVFKQEAVPSEEELAALRRGEEWDPEKAKAEKEQQQQEQAQARKSEKFIPNSNYKEKYAHLIGKEAALEAARKTETNKQYGFVPSANKKDVRSIEQTLADIQSKKKFKTSHNTSSTSAD